MCDLYPYKTMYATHEIANQALYHFMSVAKKGRKVPTRSFFCHSCERYHLTSQDKNKVQS